VSTKRLAIERYLNDVISVSMPIFPYGQAAAEWHASERVRLAQSGKTPPFADGQISAIAKVNGLILVTLNPKDFTAFAEVKVEDWSR
jgi:tRNA(fMet)-specific endonuclease VapC